MKKTIICALSGLLLICLLCSIVYSQDNDERGRIKPGGKKKEGPVIIPESEPPRDGRMMKNMFLVDIASVEVKHTAAGPTFVMKGRSKYPDNTLATVAIRFDEVKLPNTNKRIKIKKAGFEVVFDASKLWAGKKFFPGNYELEVQVDPRRQSKKQRRLIEEKLGPMGQSIAYRNHYVTVGTKEQMNKELDNLRDYYLQAISAIWAPEKLYDQLIMKYDTARARWYKKFRKLDKNKKPQVDPNNNKAYLVDEKKFRQYLKDKPNEFYDKTGAFKEDIWRNWLDDVWRAKWKEIAEDHRRIKGNYAAIAWPKQYNQMTDVLKMILKKSAECSIKLYEWNGLQVNKKDKELGIVQDFDGEWPTNTDKSAIEKIITDIRFRLQLDKYIKEKKSKEEKE